jgi:hypothetical protein
MACVFGDFLARLRDVARAKGVERISLNGGA